MVRHIAVVSCVIFFACDRNVSTTMDACAVVDAGTCTPQAPPDVVLCTLPSGRPCGIDGCYDDDGVNFCHCDDGGIPECSLVGRFITIDRCTPRCSAPSGRCAPVNERGICALPDGGTGTFMYCEDPGGACPAVGCYLSHQAPDTCGTFWCCF